LAALLEQAQQSLEAVNAARVTYVLAINSRQDKFASIHPLAARIVRALAASESSVENIKDARILKRKMGSQSQAGIPEAITNGMEGTPTPSSGTISRQDYESRAETFANLVRLIQGLPAYAPNEPELQVATLQVMVTELRNASVAVAKAYNELANARMHRNRVMFGEGGLFETANAVKDYIRSVFGVRSEPAKELTKLRLAA
jgi:hypothetical protein